MRSARGGTCEKRMPRLYINSRIPTDGYCHNETSAHSWQIDSEERDRTEGDPEVEAVMGEFGHAA